VFLDAGMNELAQSRLACDDCPMQQLCGAVILGVLDTRTELTKPVPKRHVETLETFGIEISHKRWGMCPRGVIESTGTAIQLGVYSRLDDDPLAGTPPQIVVVDSLRLAVNDMRTRLNKSLLL
jgi:hypothetical protein